MKEFNLSEKRENVMKTLGWSYPEDKVKEFIKLLKERLQHYEQGEVGTFIDKLAGKDLK